MKNSEFYYKETGKIGTGSALSICAAGTAAAALLGLIYGYATAYIPFIYVSFIITVLYGSSLGFIVGKVAYMTKVRNRTAIVGLAILVGFFAVYFSWVFWLYAASEQTILEFNPATLLNYMQDIAVDGMWSIFSYTPSGTYLYTIWTMEALFISAMTVLIGIGKIGKQPYCESCELWTEPTSVSMHLSPIENVEDLLSSLERNNLSELKKLVENNPKQLSRTQVIISNCTNCSTTYYLTIHSITDTVNVDGEKEPEEDLIVENLILTNQAYAEIMKWKSGLNAPKLEETAESTSEETES